MKAVVVHRDHGTKGVAIGDQSIKGFYGPDPKSPSPKA